MERLNSTEKSKEIEEPNDENKDRGNWASPIEFVLAALGNVVGLGNVWRFPYLAYRNGGGAFLIPYGVMLALAGLPLFFLEIAHGQYCSEGAVTCWKAMPLIRGMSFGQMITGTYISTSYNVVIMYAFYYLFASFTSVLPWIGCNHSFNTAMCSELPKACLAIGGIITTNNSCVQLQDLTEDQLDMYNVSYDANSINNTDTFDGYNLSLYKDPFSADRMTPSEEYWRFQVLQESDSMDETGGLVWQLALCLILAWIVVYICLIRGIHSIGKVVYFTATFPYVILVILLIRGLTLPGALEGIKFFVVPRWHHVLKAQVWLDAAVQIFYSLGVACGGQSTMASYNKFHYNCYRDTLLIAALNSITSIFAGFVIFSIIGFMAESSGKEVENVVSQGFGLAFIAYPEAVARMPGGFFWSICFFFMVIILGLDSQFVGMEIIITAVTDMFPRLRKYKQYITASFCGILCILGFTCVTRAGGYWMALIDQYSVNFHRFVFALAECAGLCWFYGPRRFINDIRAMIGDRIVDSKRFRFWPLTWCVITPGLMLVILAFNFVSWKEPQYNDTPFPDWAIAIGWMIMLSSLLVIPADWIYLIWITPGTYKERFRALLRPSPSWGPALLHHRQEACEVHRNHGTDFGGQVDCFKQSENPKNGLEPASQGLVDLNPV
ncbi:sodium- and chloride-dependent neutral and basic amino acid transporter B(0+)-like [Amphiura filiformis]|uniref:sodium- and chloride-dependent neutral and basic amino acid transporter B(0+)-like n=1 Tax=Amphiura filiformis TaxID=82378 RepID=UPI003B21EFE5